MKLPRSKDEPGKGGFWKLDLGRVEEGKRNRRRNSSSRSSRRSKKVPETCESAPLAVTTGLYETPPNSVSPPIPDCLPEVPESNQISLSEDDFNGLLIDSVVWDENQLNQLEYFDSLLETL